MKNLNEINEVTSLTQTEMKNIDGGWLPAVFAVVLWLATEYDDIKAGVKDAMAGKEANYDPCGG